MAVVNEGPILKDGEPFLKIDEGLVNTFLRQATRSKSIVRGKTKVLEFIPKMVGKSEILSDIMISNYIAQLPNYMQFCKWKCVYQMSSDGCSTITFFDRLRDYE